MTITRKEIGQGDRTQADTAAFEEVAAGLLVEGIHGENGLQRIRFAEICGYSRSFALKKRERKWAQMKRLLNGLMLTPA